MQIKVAVKRETRGNFTFFTTILFGRKVTFAKALVDELQSLDALHSETIIDTDKDLLVCNTVTKDGKQYTNYYLTIPKDKDAMPVSFAKPTVKEKSPAPKQSMTDGHDLPF